MKFTISPTIRSILSIIVTGLCLQVYIPDLFEQTNMVTNPFSVFLILAGIVLLAIHLEARYKLFRALSAALVGILFAMVLSNIGIIPGDSLAYDVLIDPGVSLGIVLILLGVNIKTIRQAGPVMFAAFGLGALGTAVGAFFQHWCWPL